MQIRSESSGANLLGIEQEANCVVSTETGETAATSLTLSGHRTECKNTSDAAQ
jgi:hypothetical protein